MISIDLCNKSFLLKNVSFLLYLANCFMLQQLGLYDLISLSGYEMTNKAHRYHMGGSTISLKMRQWAKQ